jgi:hypothetical protein
MLPTLMMKSVAKSKHWKNDTRYNLLATFGLSGLTTSSALAPDTTNTALNAIEDATVGPHRFASQMNVNPVPGSNMVAGCYFKQGTKRYAQILMGGYGSYPAFPRAMFDLQTGTIVNSSGTTFPPLIIKEPNGFYRCEVSGTMAPQTVSRDNYLVSLFFAASPDGADNTSGISYTGTNGAIALTYWNPYCKLLSNPYIAPLDISIATTSDLNTKRANLINEVFGAGGLPAELPTLTTAPLPTTPPMALDDSTLPDITGARTDGDLETAFASFSQQHVGAVLVSLSAFFNRRMEQLAAMAARHALPAIYPYREYALAGGLISYGGSLGYFWGQTAILTGRILKGDKPADLPVQQVTKIDLVINLKTAKALGLTIPETLLATADEVIQ